MSVKALISAIAWIVARGRGQPRKTWVECVRKDMDDLGLSGVNPQDKVAWRDVVRHSLLVQQYSSVWELGLHIKHNLDLID